MFYLSHRFDVPCRIAGRLTGTPRPYSTHPGPIKSDNVVFINHEPELCSIVRYQKFEKIKEMVEQNREEAKKTRCDANKTLLHLAVLRGDEELVGFLLDQGIDKTIKDKSGLTALGESMLARQHGVAQRLLESGDSLKTASGRTIAMALCRAASSGDIAELKRFVAAGADLSATDYDRRTPLHVAAACGNVEAVKFLLENGANTNAIDGLGNTPLSDALRGATKAKRQVRQILLGYGAHECEDIFHFRNSLEFKDSIVQSLPLLCERGNYVYAEVWIPTDDLEGLIPQPEWYAVKSYGTEFDRFQVMYSNDVVILEKGLGMAGQSLISRQPVLFGEIGPKEDFPHGNMIIQLGLKSGIAIPLIKSEKVLAVLVFFGTVEQRMSQQDMDTFCSYVNGLVMSGFRNEEVRFFDFTGISSDKVKLVYELLVTEKVFNPRHIYQEVDWWFRMEIPNAYYHTFNIDVIAKHIHCFMAAKKLAQAMGKDEEMLWAKKTSDDGAETIYLCPASYKDSVKVEREVEAYMETVPNGYAVNLKYLCSQKPFLPNGTRKLSIYIVDTTPFLSSATKDETNIWKVASSSFLTDNSFEVRSMYQEILLKSSGKIAPYSAVIPIADGTTLAILALKHKSQTSFLLRTTEVLKAVQLMCSRKFMEAFSTGVSIYTFYLQTTDQNLVNEFLTKVKLISIVPGRTLSTHFLDGSLSVEEYAYASAVRKFTYYFMNTTDEDTQSLNTALKGDIVNLDRLNRLRSKLRREAVSTARLAMCITSNLPLVKKLYQDFRRCAEQGPSYSLSLFREITQNVGDVLDVQIMNGFLMFNSSILKTNFWKESKASLAFSFYPNFVMDCGFPFLPYCIYFILGTEFQGFHIRFRDIARGGIRVIRSLDTVSFIKNLEGQFTENYELALTQQKKNKDIPEFGSKGTILLNKEAQGANQISFQKYVSGTLDLLLSRTDKEIVDHYAKEEILFLGPDEYSADQMDWACLYAKERGYPFWKAFTTGKVAALGGIPHDVFGMTTSSIHTFVLGCLERLGLREEDVTKIQTGGPDGDLGSNEILISKDKTIAVIDGSGVLYDPEGIDRTELERLAKLRLTVNNFDSSKLTKGGFLVCVTENKVTLPSGEIVESGLLFRNEFHLHPLATADLFVPCGGRPNSVNLMNVERLIQDGKPKFKIIVEGANLFFSEEARIMLENSGVILYKDASANKGGVTSSSLEVLAALAMTDEEHMKFMQVQDLENPPAFYSEYVDDVKKIIRKNAYLEFATIWNEHERTGTPRSVLSTALYDKIIKLCDDIEASDLFNHDMIRTAIMGRAIPKSLQNIIPLEEILSRLPLNYSRAIFNSALSSRFVYRYGLEPSEFAFFQFVDYLRTSPTSTDEDLPKQTPTAPPAPHTRPLHPSLLQRPIGKGKAKLGKERTAE